MAEKTLVIILSETRAHELTFDNFKQKVLDELNADLCLCIGVKKDYDRTNPFYVSAKYIFEYPEPDDYAVAFDYALQEIKKTVSSDIFDGLPWREFLKIPDQFLGGIKDSRYQHPGSAGILIFFRWFLLKNLREANLINSYDKFIITRSDYLYRLPHPKMSLFTDHIYIPDCEDYSGFTDRHVVLSRRFVEPYLNILPNMILRSREYWTKMMEDHRNYRKKWNLEQLIQLHLTLNGVVSFVKRFPYVMYTVRPINGSTRWQKGIFYPELGYYIKYSSEYQKSQYYLDYFVKSGKKIDDFYRDYIQ